MQFKISYDFRSLQSKKWRFQFLIFKGGKATVPIFKTQLRSVFPGPPIYFTEFILGMVISYYHIRMGI